MGGCWVGGIKWRCFQYALGDIRHWRGIKDFVLHEEHVRNLSVNAFASQLTQLTFGSKNLHHTPSSSTSRIRRHRFKKTANIRFRNSIIPASSFAFVGLAA